MRRLFEVNSEPHTGARPSVRLCVGLTIAAKGRCLLSVGVPFEWGFIRWDVNFIRWDVNFVRWVSFLTELLL